MTRLLTPMILVSVVYYVSTSVLTHYENHAPLTVAEIHKQSIQEQYKQLECLTENIYYESTGEPVQGMIGVGQVTVNRKDKKSETVCNTVYKPSQFSWVNNKPRRLAAMPRTDILAYNNAKMMAKKVLWEGETVPCIKKATHYHADWITPPSWTKDMKFLCKVGKHLYYEDKKF